MIRAATAFALLLLVSTALAGCSIAAVGGGEEILIVAGERDGGMYFEPSAVTVPIGKEVTFVIKNEGSIDHEFESIEKGEAGIEEIIVPAGLTRRVHWTAPSDPATYPVYCDLPGHRAAGMELTLVVVEGSSSPQSVR